MDIKNKLFTVQTEMGKIYKNASNPFHKSKYENIEGILEEINPLLVEAKCVLSSTSVVNEFGHFLDTSLIDLESEGVITVSCPIEASGANKMQAWGSALTYARRYNLRNLFNIVTTDDDGEGATAKPLKAKNVEAKKTSGSNEFVIPVGKNQGKTLKEMGLKAAEEWGVKYSKMIKDAGKETPEWFSVDFSEAFKKLKKESK